MSETEIPVEAVVPQFEDVRLSTGAMVRVSTLTVGGLFKVVAAIRRANITQFPVGISPVDLLEPDQRTQYQALDSAAAKGEFLQSAVAALGDEKRSRLAEAFQKKMAVVLEWVCASEQILPAFIASVTNLSEAEVGKLQVHDLLALAGKAMPLFNVRATVEAGAAFFTQIGGLMEAVGEQTTRRQPSASRG